MLETNRHSVHATAVIHPGAEIGEGTQIGPYAIVEENVQIGESCSVSAHAVIKKGVRLGNRNQVCEGVVLGGWPQHLRRAPDRSYVIIGDDNVFREGMTVNRSCEEDGQTRIGDFNYLMSCSHVAHCVLEDHIVLANTALLAGHVRVEDHAFISGGVVIHQFNRVGRHSMIGGGSRVAQDALPFFVVEGFRARVRGVNVVGLRRNGFSPEEIRNLKLALRILREPARRLEERLERLTGIESASVQYLVAFIKGSTRGFCRPKR
jgi:UDP-N-acetylglucosamine acyltransferase